MSRFLLTPGYPLVLLFLATVRKDTFSFVFCAAAGFAFGSDGKDMQAPKSADYVSDARISAVVLGYDEATKTAHIAQRNRFQDGETLSILSPSDVGRSFAVSGIRNEAGEMQQAAPHPKQILYIGCSEPVKEGDLLRKIN